MALLAASSAGSAMVFVTRLEGKRRVDLKLRSGYMFMMDSRTEPLY
jgi:hypothetical protein